MSPTPLKWCAPSELDVYKVPDKIRHPEFLPAAENCTLIAVPKELDLCIYFKKAVPMGTAT